MVRLKDVQMYKIDDIPEHVMQEMTDLAVLLLTEWQEMSKEVHSNIAMGAWNFAHAVILVEALQDHFAHKGANLAALSLIKNVEMLLTRKGIPFTPIGKG